MPTTLFALSSVRSVDIKNGSLRTDDMSANTLSALQGQQGLPGEPGIQGEPGVQGEPGDPASDVFGEYATSYSGSSTIGKIGGTSSTNATELGTLTISEDGKYMINAYGYFDRLNDNEAGYVAPTTDTYLQLTVRGPAGFIETTAQSVQVIDAHAGDVLTVRAFGYNEDRSGFGTEGYEGHAAQFKVAASVSAIRIG